MCFSCGKLLGVSLLTAIFLQLPLESLVGGQFCDNSEVVLLRYCLDSFSAPKRNWEKRQEGIKSYSAALQKLLCRRSQVVNFLIQ